VVQVVFSERARLQLLELYDFIADSSSLESAYRFTTALNQHCHSLADFPNRGVAHDHVRPGLRTLVFRGRVTITYSVEADTVTVLGIFYAGRDWQSDVEL
jgi:toxin ParE1/3/4